MQILFLALFLLAFRSVSASALFDRPDRQARDVQVHSPPELETRARPRQYGVYVDLSIAIESINEIDAFLRSQMGDGNIMKAPEFHDPLWSVIVEDPAILVELRAHPGIIMVWTSDKNPKVRDLHKINPNENANLDAACRNAGQLKITRVKDQLRIQPRPKIQMIRDRKSRALRGSYIGLGYQIEW